MRADAPGTAGWWFVLTAVLLSACPSPEPAPCRSQADCPGTVCRAVPEPGADLTRLRFRCGGPVGPGAASDPCQSGSDCGSGFCSVAGGCVRPCARDADCGEGLACRTVYTRTGPDVLQPHGACVASPRVPAGVRTHRIQSQLSAPDLQRLELGVSASTVEAYFQVDRPSDNLLAIASAGYTNRPPFFSRASVLAGSPPDGGVNLAGNPITLRTRPGLFRPPPDRLWVELQALNPELWPLEAPVPLDVWWFERAQPGERLDLVLYYVGTELQPRSDAEGPRLVEDALERVFRRFQPAFERGRIRHRPVDGMLGARLGVVDSRQARPEAGSDRLLPGELEQLFRLSAGSDRPAVHVFLVQDLGPLLGISGGIPGPALLPGTLDSGLAVSLAAPGQAVATGFIPEHEEADFLALVLAHELGHHLGLFHTTEPTGIRLDSVPDTPWCTVDDFDADRDGRVTMAECEGAGRQNLMFYAPPLQEARAAQLTAGQLQALSSALILR